MKSRTQFLFLVCAILVLISVSATLAHGGDEHHAEHHEGHEHHEHLNHGEHGEHGDHPHDHAHGGDHQHDHGDHEHEHEHEHGDDYHHDDPEHQRHHELYHGRGAAHHGGAQPLEGQLSFLKQQLADLESQLAQFSQNTKERVSQTFDNIHRPGWMHWPNFNAYHPLDRMNNMMDDFRSRYHPLDSLQNRFSNFHPLTQAQDAWSQWHPLAEYDHRHRRAGHDDGDTRHSPVAQLMMSSLDRFHRMQQQMQTLQDKMKLMMARHQPPLGDTGAQVSTTGEEDSQSVAAAWNPNVAVSEDDSTFLIHADLPGVKTKDVDVDIEERTLCRGDDCRLVHQVRLRGHRENKRTEKNQKSIYEEMSSGYFERVLTLPDNVDAKQAKATVSSGVLELRFPKTKVAELKPSVTDVEVTDATDEEDDSAVLNSA